jgi:hypothetical protein
MRDHRLQRISTSCYNAGNCRTKIPHIDNLSLYSLVSGYAGKGETYLGGANSPEFATLRKRIYSQNPE